MVIDNPLVQDTAQQTMGEVIHSLQYMALTIPIPEHENEDGETVIQLSRAQMCGLRNLIQCSQAAVESCYNQIGKELGQCQCSKQHESEQPCNQNRQNEQD